MTDIYFVVCTIKFAQTTFKLNYSQSVYHMTRAFFLYLRKRKKTVNAVSSYSSGVISQQSTSCVMLVVDNFGVGLIFWGY